MRSPNKRQKMSAPEDLDEQNDFVPLGCDDEEEKDGGGEQYGYSNEQEDAVQQLPANAPSGPRGNRFNPRNRDDPRNAKDRPKSKHALPGHGPWVLVKTKLRRYFVHNTATGESLWHTPSDLRAAVQDFFVWEKTQEEKEANAKWAELQLQDIRTGSNAVAVNKRNDKEQRQQGEEGSSRRRRSESLQKEDEEAMLAELAAQAEHTREQDAKEAVSNVRTYEPRAADAGYDSEGSYEYVEVTESEEEEEEQMQMEAEDGMGGEAAARRVEADGPVELGEDDIAYQLAAMGAEYGLEPDEYGANVEPDGDNYGDDQQDQGLGISEQDATNLFHEMLDEHRVNPYTPWDKLISDQSSILDDDRFTIFTSSKARKEAHSTWTKDAIARLKEERAKMEARDPRIPYLAFLQEKATLKLYWPEFKRKYKREPELNDRKLLEKERERLYRDHITRVKLPESTRKADLLVLLQSVPLSLLNKDTRLDALPQRLLGHLHFISLPSSIRDELVERHIASLPPAPDEDGEVTGASGEQEGNDGVSERDRRATVALAERQRKVEEERRRAEKEERFARRGLGKVEREVERAMHVRGRVG